MVLEPYNASLEVLPKLLGSPLPLDPPPYRAPMIGKFSIGIVRFIARSAEVKHYSDICIHQAAAPMCKIPVLTTRQLYAFIRCYLFCRAGLVTVCS